MKSLRYLQMPAAVLAVWIAYAQTAAIDPTVYLNDIKFLASQEMRGRATGSPELEKAAAFIVGKYREAGLQPIPGKEYLQAFKVTTGSRLGPANRFEFTENGRTTTLNPSTDFVPFSFSSVGKLGGTVVFAGYGITAPEYHYDDYAGIDVKGTLVLILRHEPQEFDEHSVFAGKEFTKHATFTSKASNAKMHGAAGVILISDRANHRSEADDLPKFGPMEGPADAGIPFVQVKEDRVEGWFADAGKSLEGIEADIDKDLKPESFAFPDSIRVDGAVDIERDVEDRPQRGGIPARRDRRVRDHRRALRSPGAGRAILLAPSLAGTVHPGADDNASGTAGVIELARWFARQPKQKRGILFLTFAGEELGLLGSQWYVEHPELPLDNAVAMINMDMIGRVRNGKLYIGGADTGSTCAPCWTESRRSYQMNIDYSDSPGYGSSDHTSFTTNRCRCCSSFPGCTAIITSPATPGTRSTRPTR